MKISTSDKIAISGMSIVSIAIIIFFLFYVIFLINYAYQYGLPKRDDSEPIYEFISNLGVYITLGLSILLGPVVLIIGIAKRLERNDEKLKKLEKQQEKVIYAFVVFTTSFWLFLVITSASYSLRNLEVENDGK